MFIQLEHVNGYDIQLNINFIVALTPTEPGSICTVIGDLSYEVRHTPDAILEAIQAVVNICLREKDVH